MGNNNRSVSSFVLVRHSRLRVVVMVEVRGRAGGERLPRSPSPRVPSMAICVQPWHDALLKIGNALIMMFCG